MSTSTDAILVFGVDFGNDDSVFSWTRDDMDIEDWWAGICGVAEPECEWDSHNAEVQAEWREYWRKKRDAFASCPVDFVHHCHIDYGMYILSVKGTEQTANRGYPLHNPKMGDVDPKPLLEFCEKYGIELPHEPCWILCSYWG